MKILVSGSSGLVGSALVTQLTSAGHFVVRLVRDMPQSERQDVFWDPVSAKIERGKLERLDAIVHLGGENLAGLWTGAKKNRIYTSRVSATEFLVQTIVGLTNKPSVFVCASATGFYGSRGDEWLQETSPAGAGWLASLCQDWEAATATAQNAGIRVVRARMGAVLSPKGGLLGAMIKPFKMGLGGRLGNGKQYLRWIAMTDLVRALQFAIEKEYLYGPVNFVTAQPVTNREFTHALAHILDRPVMLPVPAFALKMLPGDMANEMLLASQRCQPAKLAQNGFKFEFSELSGALRHLISARL